MPLITQDKTNWKFLLIVVILAAIVGGGIWWWVNFTIQKPVACTQEAKICPDGSAVGRTGSNCEFAPCPATNIDETVEPVPSEVEGWQIYRNEKYGFEIKYPADWKYKNYSAGVRFLSNEHQKAEEEYYRALEEGLTFGGGCYFGISINIKNRIGDEIEDCSDCAIVENVSPAAQELLDKFPGAFEIYHYGYGPDYSIGVPFPDDDKKFASLEVCGLPLVDDSNRYKEIQLYNQMLSTFRFIESANIAEPIKTCVDNCGNGICEEVVCLAIGCPCPETRESCPQDCDTKTEIKIPQIEIKNFTTDKKTYISNEDLKASLVISSLGEIKGVTIKLTGIKPYNYAYINSSQTVNLISGENKIIFTEKTPTCTSGCGGVYPGPYDLNAKIFINENLVASSTVSINLTNE